MLRTSIALAVLLAAGAGRAQVGGTTQSGTATQAGAGGQGGQQEAQPGQGGSQQGGASQQVVVNPPNNANPPPPQSPPPQQSPPSSTTVVNPPPSYGETVVVDRDPPKPPMATIATGAAWGGLAGLLVGTGVALIDEWDHWQRDMMIGTGIGVLVGAAVGGVQAYSDHQDARRSRVALDGMGSPARDPVTRGGRVVFGYAGRF